MTVARRGDGIQLRAVDKLAGRLATLRLDKNEEIALVSVALGAVYAIMSAQKLHYVGSASDVTTAGHVRKFGEKLSQRELPQTGRYLAGYYFNDALLRLDIGYENVVRRLVQRRCDETIGTLIDLAIERGHRESEFGSWRKIREEVNRLKHRSREQIAHRTSGHGVDMRMVVAAIERLVPLVEKVVSRGRHS